MNRRIELGLPLVAAWLLMLWLAGPALAEQADRSKPVNIEANSVQMDDLHKTSLYEGDVILTQGTLQVHADRVAVKQDAAGFNQATAWGNPVYFRQKQDNSDEYLEGWANRLDMDNAKNTVLMTGNARLKKGADEMHASSMLYNTATQQFSAQRDTSLRPDGRPDRVRTAIFPKATQPAQPAPDSGVPLQTSGAIQDGTASHE